MRNRTGHSLQGYDGEPSYGHLGRADARPSRVWHVGIFPRAPWPGRRSPSRAFFHGRIGRASSYAKGYGGQGRSALPGVARLHFPTGTLAWQTFALPGIFPRASWPSRRSALPGTFPRALCPGILLRQGYGVHGRSAFSGHAVAMACFSAVHSRSSRPTTIAEAVDKKFGLYCLSTYPVDFCNRS